MSTKKWIHSIAFVLVIIGGINWGLFGIIPVAAGQDGFDLVQILLDNLPGAATLEEIVYIAIAASAIYLAYTHSKECKVCSAK
jgi:uncharacterized membrane protein YuzA (DUF378 family)